MTLHEYTPYHRPWLIREARETHTPILLHWYCARCISPETTLVPALTPTPTPKPLTLPLTVVPRQLVRSTAASCFSIVLDSQTENTPGVTDRDITAVRWILVFGGGASGEGHQGHCRQPQRGQLVFFNYSPGTGFASPDHWPLSRSLIGAQASSSLHCC